MRLHIASARVIAAAVLCLVALALVIAGCGGGSSSSSSSGGSTESSEGSGASENTGGETAEGEESSSSESAFPKAANDGALKLLVSGYADDAAQDGILKIEADAALYGGRLKAGAALSHRLRGQAYLLVSDGEIEIGGKTMKKGDGAEITGLDTLSLTAGSEAELVLIDLPAAA